MELTITPLETAQEIGEEAEVYGYGCTTDCLHWRNKEEPGNPNCWILADCWSWCYW